MKKWSKYGVVLLFLVYQQEAHTFDSLEIEEKFDSVSVTRIEAMQNRQPIIFEFPTNLGLRVAIGEPGVRFLPKWLQKHSFYDLFDNSEIITLIPPAYTKLMHSVTGVLNTDSIVSYSKKQAELLFPKIKPENFLIIVGGDCSILIGSGLAHKMSGKYGLFFIDGHTDFIGPELSTTGGAAGMDLALSTGNGHDILANINNLGPYFEEENVWCVGNRELGEDYIEPILNSKIHYYDLNKLRQTGIEICVNEFLQMVESKGLDGFFIHFDVDVLDDEIMPAVDSRQPDGLSYKEMQTILGSLFSSEKATGIEITILDPTLDKNGYYTSGFVNAFGKAYQKLMNASN